MRINPKIQMIISIALLSGLVAFFYLQKANVDKKRLQNGRVIVGQITGVTEYSKTRSAVIVEFEYKRKKYSILNPTHCFKPSDSLYINNLKIEVFCDTVNPKESIGLLSRTDYDRYNLYYSKYVNTIEKLKKCK
jgi:hypothetical protein